MELTPINDQEFRKILRGCGIKYYCKIPRTELKISSWILSDNKNKKKS